MPNHRRGRLGRGHSPNSGKKTIFLANFVHNSGILLIFPYIFGQKCLPPKLTEVYNPMCHSNKLMCFRTRLTYAICFFSTKFAGWVASASAVCIGLNSTNMYVIVWRHAGEAATGVSREDYIDTVANDIIGKLPANFDIDKTRKKFGRSISPTSVVLLQELERFNNLLKRMRKSLSTLRKVGLFVVTARSILVCYWCWFLWFRRLISEVAWSIVTTFGHMFDGVPNLYKKYFRLWPI